MKLLFNVAKGLVALVFACMVGIWVGVQLDITDKKVEANVLVPEEIAVKSVNPIQPTDIEVPKESKVSKEVKEDKSSSKVPFSEDIVSELTLKFEAPIYWAVYNDDVLTDYSTIEDLLQSYYVTFADYDIASNFVYSFFYQDEKENVTLKPGALPSLFQVEQEFEMVEIDDNQYKVKQVFLENDNEITWIVYNFFYNEISNSWMIQDIYYD